LSKKIEPRGRTSKARYCDSPFSFRTLLNGRSTELFREKCGLLQVPKCRRVGNLQYGPTTRRSSLLGILGMIDELNGDGKVMAEGERKWGRNFHVLHRSPTDSGAIGFASLGGDPQSPPKRGLVEPSLPAVIYGSAFGRGIRNGIEEDKFIRMSHLKRLMYALGPPSASEDDGKRHPIRSKADTYPKRRRPL